MNSVLRHGAFVAAKNEINECRKNGVFEKDGEESLLSSTISLLQLFTDKLHVSIKAVFVEFFQLNKLCAKFWKR